MQCKNAITKLIIMNNGEAKNNFGEAIVLFSLPLASLFLLSLSSGLAICGRLGVARFVVVAALPCLCVDQFYQVFEIIFSSDYSEARATTSIY